MSRIVCSAFLALQLAALPVIARAAGAPIPPGVDPKVVLHWNTPDDTSTAHRGTRTAPLELLVTISDVDTIMGFEIEIRVRRAEDSHVWRFLAEGECPQATLDVDATGTREVAAPWRSKILLSDARELEAGRSRLMAIAAFHLEPLDTSASYTLCRLRLTPPAGHDEACPGWDSGATFELVRAGYLRGDREQIEISRLGPPLVFELQSGD